MKNIVLGAFAAALLASVALPAVAADLPSMKSAPTLAVDDSFDPFLVRIRALGILPDASGSTATVAVLGGPGRIAGASISDSVVPEVDFTYFMTKHWAVEVIAAISHHRLTESQYGALGIANTTVLPPTVTLQYHFALGAFDPYVGLGANYTWFLDTRSPAGVALGANSQIVNIHSAAGLSANFGADYYLNKHWVLNFDVKKLFLSTDANVSLVGQNVVHVNVDPWIIGGGIGYRFGGSESTAVVAKY